LKAWQRSWPRGRMVDHPAVVAEAARAHPSSRAVERQFDGLKIVTYGSTRVHLDRRAWEMLSPDGVLLIRVQPSTGPGFALAFTADELAAVFGEVRETRSWETVRCYHFSKPPPAISSFRVMTGAAPRFDSGDQPTGAPHQDHPTAPSHPPAPGIGRSARPIDVGSPPGRIGRTELPGRRRPRRYELDGVDQLEAVLVRAGYPSVTAAVAEHTVFLHPDTVAQTHGSALFPVVRSMARRGQIDVDSDGRRVLFDDNLSPTNAFVWAGRISRGRDVQFNHIWSDSSNRDAYTALWNLCATPAFLAKTTDTHPEVTAALRFRAYSLYEAVALAGPEPIKPDAYDSLCWAPHPEPVEDLERVLRERLHSSPKSRTAIACREIGWLYSDWVPDTTI
jgi:hypothetical protein